MKTFIGYFVIGICLLLVSCHDRKAIRNAKLQAESFTRDTFLINSTNRHAVKLLQKRNIDSALYTFNRNLQQSVAINYVDGIGFGYWYTGVAYFYKYDYDTALVLHNKAYNIYENSGNKRGMALVRYSMLYDYSLKQDMPRSLENAEEARRLFEEIKDYVKVYDCLEAIVYAHRSLNHTIEVDSLMAELVNIAEKTGNKRRIANSYYNLGSYYIDKAYLNLAIEAFFKALEIAEESGHSSEIANALGSVGLAYIYMKDYKNAIAYYLKQEVILKSEVNQYELSVTYTNLGESYNALGDYTTGLKYHQKALEIRKEMNFHRAISNALHNIGYTYYLMKDSADKALDYTKQTLEMDTQIKNDEGFAKSYMLMGKIQVIKENKSAGIRYLEKSIQLAKQYNNTQVIKEASEALILLYADKRNFGKAFTNMVINKEISDSLVSGDNIKRITQLEMQHSFEKKQNETEVGYLKEKLGYESTLKRNRLILAFSFVFGTLVVMFGVFLYHSYLKSRKAEKEKEALLKEIHHRVKNNLMVISSLLNLQLGSLTDEFTKSAVKESQSRVKSMALIHQLLYQSEMFTCIDFPKYLDQLMASLQSAYSKPDKNVKYIIQADPIMLDIDTAIPIGLIINELITNAYKYAFSNSTCGIIEIDFVKTANHNFLLRISDDGKGLPEGFDPDNSPTLGLKLVKILTKQIRGKLNYSNKSGAEFNLVFSETLT
jgi:two-component sensor histidine kinase